MTPTNISDKQREANRRNSQHSTGPKTEAGRNRSKYNGVKHGLTGRTVVLPTEDMAAYKRFSEELVESFAPKRTAGHSGGRCAHEEMSLFERQLAQTIADAQWRLNRARSFEDGMLCAGSFGPARDIETENPQVHAVLTASQVFKEDSKSFVNLTLYEQRLHRQQKQAFEQLKAIQAQRKAEEKAAMDKTKLLYKRHKMKGMIFNPAENGFAFSTTEIEAECLRDRSLEEAIIARIVDYDLKEYEARVAGMAA